MRIAILISLLSVCSGSPAAAEMRPNAALRIPVDMIAGWLRRDWDKCNEPSTLSTSDSALTIATRESAALYWQVPTRTGDPLEFDLDRGWIKDCDRPPSDFGREIQSQAEKDDLLIDAGTHRWVTWKWRVSNTVDDSRTIDRKGRVQPEGDDFAAKIGITVLKKGTDDIREISYVWTRTIPEETLLVQEKRVLFWKFQFFRIVAQSGDREVGRWVAESRDLYADYKRIYPDEEPGRIVRVYLMSDSDNTGGEVTGSFADLAFHAAPPTSTP